MTLTRFNFLSILTTFLVAILMDTAACLQRMFGRPPATAVAMQCSASSMESHGSSNTHNSVEAWFRAASSFWSPMVLRVIRDKNDHRGKTNRGVRPSSRYNNNTSSDPDEVAISQWIVQGGTVTARYAVLQNLDQEQRIVWRTDNHSDSDNK